MEVKRKKLTNTSLGSAFAWHAVPLDLRRSKLLRWLECPRSATTGRPPNHSQLQISSLLEDSMPSSRKLRTAHFLMFVGLVPLLFASVILIIGITCAQANPDTAEDFSGGPLIALRNR